MTDRDWTTPSGQPCHSAEPEPLSAQSLGPDGRVSGVGGAVISPCGLYRYRLERTSSPHNANTVIIMVNPSTADAETGDATIRKLKGFGARRGWTNLIVGNLFAYRTKDVR